MKITRLLLVIALAFPGFFLTTCSQEPLFYYIHLEYPPIEPIIGGAPMEIVKLGDVVYAANRTSLWKYDMNAPDPILNVPIWEKIPTKPSGAIRAIAATSTHLYVLDDNGTIHRSSDGGATWGSTVYISDAQKIYGATDKLFAGDGSAVYECDFTSTPPTKTKITGSPDSNIPGGLLRGAVKIGSAYYICTAKVQNENTGIFTVSGTTATLEHPDSVKGIIAADSTPTSTIIAVTGSAIIYKNSGAAAYSVSSSGVSFTGGMALWEHSGDKKILLGLQRGGSGTFRYGYRELDLDGSGNVNGSGSVPIYAPGNTDNGNRSSTSIDPGSTQTSAIGKYPVNALYVIPISPAPDSGDSAGRPIILASTQQNGVWSYRVRRGTAQWNGEDNNTR
jgi:hypothetical protein